MVAYLKRGDTYRRRGDLNAALRDYQMAVELDPAAVKPLERLGDVQAGLSRFDAAVDAYRGYVALDDGSPQVFYKLALTLYRDGQPGIALEPLRRAITLDERFAGAHYLLGLCLRDAKRLPEAVDAFERSQRAAPAFIQPREQLADLYSRVGRQADALWELEALTALDPNRPERYIALAQAYARSNRTEAAVLTLSRAAERFADTTAIYAALGRVWLEAALQRSDRVALRKAIEALEDAAGRGEASSEQLTLLGRALFASGEHDRAHRLLVDATTRYPLAPDAFLQLAGVAERRGRLVDARRALLQHLDLYPADEPAGRAARIGDLSMRLNDSTTAAVYFARAAAASPTPSVDLLVRLADAHWRAGSRDEARAALRRAAATAPAAASVRRLQRQFGAS
jgi:tetratricopeptide (TPR) repeat protein